MAQLQNHMDYELELGLVIGKIGKNLAPSEALTHLFGITILNDFSARDIQGVEMSSGFGPAKGEERDSQQRCCLLCTWHILFIDFHSYRHRHARCQVFSGQVCCKY